jgi:hypothetical protein
LVISILAKLSNSGSVLVWYFIFHTSVPDESTSVGEPNGQRKGLRSQERELDRVKNQYKIVDTRIFDVATHNFETNQWTFHKSHSFITNKGSNTMKLFDSHHPCGPLFLSATVHAVDKTIYPASKWRKGGMKMNGRGKGVTRRFTFELNAPKALGNERRPVKPTLLLCRHQCRSKVPGCMSSALGNAKAAAVQG